MPFSVCLLINNHNSKISIYHKSTILSINQVFICYNSQGSEGVVCDCLFTKNVGLNVGMRIFFKSMWRLCVLYVAVRFTAVFPFFLFLNIAFLSEERFQKELPSTNAISHLFSLGSPFVSNLIKRVLLFRLFISH